MRFSNFVSRRDPRLSVMALLLVLCLPTVVHAAAETMTNETVIGLFKAGFSEGIVIEKIRTSPTKFDTSLAALTALKEAGVTDSVIRLMINPKAELAAPVVVATGGTGVVGAVAATPVGCELPPGSAVAPWLVGTSPAMWYSQGEDGKRTEINHERGTIKSVGFAFVSVKLLAVKPPRAALRLPGDVVFWSCINPNDMPLVKFTVDMEDDEEDRERQTSLGRGTQFHQDYSISDEDLVPMTFEKTPQGYFKVTARTRLAPGEYGFVPQATAESFRMGERVYAFGVD